MWLNQEQPFRMRKERKKTKSSPKSSKFQWNTSGPPFFLLNNNLTIEFTGLHVCRACSEKCMVNQHLLMHW